MSVGLGVEGVAGRRTAGRSTGVSAAKPVPLSNEQADAVFDAAVATLLETFSDREADGLVFGEFQARLRASVLVERLAFYYGAGKAPA